MGLFISCRAKAILFLATLGSLRAQPTWIRPADSNGPLIWGRTDGIVFGIPSPGGLRGPRGLIRIGVPGQNGGPAELVNFIAMEPVIAVYTSRFSRMGFSELDMSQLDPGQRGKRMRIAGAPAGELTSIPRPPSLIEILGGAPRGSKPPALERLEVRIDIEAFANKAHVYVIASMLSDHPNELNLAVHADRDSAVIEELIPTATMGNYERLRWLWLKDRVVDSRGIQVGVDQFRDLENFPLDEMLRYGEGDALVLCTTNEDDPSATQVPASPNWSYKPRKLTQYWKIPARHIQPDLRTKVNVRKTYWASKLELPGGTAFENFELRQRYVPGQVYIFGLSEKAPSEFEPKIPRLAPRPN